MESDMDFRPVNSGVPGLDDLLNGGYIPGRMYLVRGRPGTGKTLLGQHFLEAGLQNDETVLYIHGEEEQESITANASALGIDIADAEFLDLGPDTDFFTEDISYDLVEPSAIESERFIEDIKDVVDGYDPGRVLLDPITQLQYLERNEYQYRKRLLSFMRYLKSRETTVLTTRTLSEQNAHEQIESLSDGVINLSHDSEGRRIEIVKHRGLGQQDGTHGFEIREQGIEVYPQVIPSKENREFDPELLSSGVPTFDDLLGGGIERGSVTFITGPTGVGKTTVGTQFLAAACDRGEDALVYHFDENKDQFSYRSEGVGYPISELQDQGRLRRREIEPLVRSAEEVAQMIRADIEECDPDIVLLDSIDGYKLSLQGTEPRLASRLHALTRYLKNQDIAVLLTDEMDQITGIPSATSENTSYIADNVIVLSYLEQQGSLRRVMGVLKKRLGGFEHQFRWFTIDEDGIAIGDQLREVQGILQGQPVSNE